MARIGRWLGLQWDTCEQVGHLAPWPEVTEIYRRLM